MGLPLFLSTLFLAMSGLTGAAGDQPGDAHEPIRIESNADLRGMDLLARNGVRGGSGTASDPYVISDWTIRPAADETAVHVTGTTAHVLIDNLTIQAAGLESTAVFASQTANLHIRNLFISGGGADVIMLGSSNAVIERAIMASGNIKASGNHDLVVMRNQLGGGSIDIDSMGRTVVRDNIVSDGEHFGIKVAATPTTAEPPVFDALLERNRVQGVPIGILVTAAARGHACHNMVEGAEDTGIEISANGYQDPSFEVCWNRVEGAGAFGILLDDLRAASIHNNTVTRSAVGFTWADVTGTIRDNYVTENAIGFALSPDPDGFTPVVRHNVIVNNQEAARNAFRLTVNVEENWWGTGQHPKVAGDETGNNRIVGPVDVTPWCLTPSCDRLSTDDVTVPVGGAWALLAIAAAALAWSGARRRR
jgi:hypothetical protein